MGRVQCRHCAGSNVLEVGINSTAMESGPASLAAIADSHGRLGQDIGIDLTRWAPDAYVVASRIEKTPETV